MTRLAKVHDIDAIYPPLVKVDFKHPDRPAADPQTLHVRDDGDDGLVLEGVTPRQADAWLRVNGYRYVTGTNGLWARQ